MNMNKPILIAAKIVLKAMEDKWGADSREYAIWKSTFEIMDDQFNVIEPIKGMRDVAQETVEENGSEYARGYRDALDWVQKLAEGDGWNE